jgi:hypothetical protein
MEITDEFTEKLYYFITNNYDLFSSFNFDIILPNISHFTSVLNNNTHCSAKDIRIKQITTMILTYLLIIENA